MANPHRMNPARMKCSEMGSNGCRRLSRRGEGAGVRSRFRPRFSGGHMNPAGHVLRARPMAKRTTFVRRRIGDQTVDLSAFVVLREILGDRHAVLPHEQEAVAILVDLHLVAGADPSPQLGLRLLVLVKITWAERFSQFIHVRGQALDDRLGHGGIGMKRRSALFRDPPHELPYLLYTLWTWFGHADPPTINNGASNRCLQNDRCVSA